MVGYLVDRYGFWRIRRVLKTLAEGEPLEQVLAKEYHLKLDRLERNWRQWLPKWIDGAR